MLGTEKSLRDARHIDKTFYLGSDDRFYELNYLHYNPSDELLAVVKTMVEDDPSDWDVRRTEVWTHIAPVPAGDAPSKLLTQGWKIHISATNINCKEILARIAGIAIERQIQFKFANDVETMRLMTSKSWTRGGSGKFITVYPSSDEEFRDFIECAYIALKGYKGSYILSDRRYKDSRCVYYRYGGIKSVSRLDYLGRRLEILTSPDGEEVLDRRSPYYDLPHWVTDPYPHQADDEQDEMTLNDGRFLIKNALAFSNTGGVYLATDGTTGQDVVIKEARPGVELGVSGEDATARLAKEAAILSFVGGMGVVPRLHDTFWDWENFYLVEEYLDADDMRGVMLTGTPLLRVNPTQADSEAFYRTHHSIFVSLLEAIERLHAIGVVVGDLSPTNILVDKVSRTVRIIDLEGAFRPEQDGVQDIHTPGFRAQTKGRKKESNFGDDIYAIGVIMMYSIFPVAAMTYIRADLFANVLPVLIADVGWANTPVLKVIRRLIDNSITCREAIDELSADPAIVAPLSMSADDRPMAPLADMARELVRFVTGNYRLEDVYTLFPADPFGRSSNPLGFGFGTTGIVYSLATSGFDVPEEALHRYRRELDGVDPDDLPPGFLIGTAGMAWALLASGEVDAGRRFLRSANASPLARDHHSLYYGMAGIGMANLAAYHITGERSHLDDAIRLAEVLADTAWSDERGLYWRDDGGIRIGYGYGQSGVALFFLRLSQILGEPAWRELGRRALEYDLSFGHGIEPGVVSFADSPDNMQTYEQYLEQGSGGIAKVAIRYGMWDRIDGLFADVHRKYSAFPGLIYGLSGFVDVLTDAYLYSGDEKFLALAERPLRGLHDLYLFDTGQGYAAPGENLFRISCDFATGLAGIIRTLHRRDRLLPDELCLDWLDRQAGA